MLNKIKNCLNNENGCPGKYEIFIILGPIISAIIILVPTIIKSIN